MSEYNYSGQPSFRCIPRPATSADPHAWIGAVLDCVRHGLWFVRSGALHKMKKEVTKAGKMVASDDTFRACVAPQSPLFDHSSFVLAPPAARAETRHQIRWRWVLIGEIWCVCACTRVRVCLQRDGQGAGCDGLRRHHQSCRQGHESRGVRATACGETPNAHIFLLVPHS
jgi:hypothetical protein